MDMRDWMRGEVPFSPPNENSEPGVRYYGVYETRKGLRTFITRYRSAIPSDTLEVRSAPGKVTDLVEKMLQKHLARLRSPSPMDDEQEQEEAPEENLVAETFLIPSVAPQVTFVGRVGHHSDGGRVHSLICLSVEDGECAVLFLSAHPWWNPFSRPMTEEEAIFVGWPKKQTHLAPVFRPFSEISWTPRYFPEHRVEDLKAEFFTPAYTPRIRKF